MVGARLREARLSQARSLADVAGHARVSVATLSRIENDKQSIDLRLFLLLAKILDVSAGELLSEEEPDQHVDLDPLTRRVAALPPRDRVDFWRNMAADRRAQRAKRRGDLEQLAQHVEELVAHVDFMREELEAVRKRVKSR